MHSPALTLCDDVPVTTEYRNQYTTALYGTDGETLAKYSVVAEDEEEAERLSREHFKKKSLEHQRVLRFECELEVDHIFDTRSRVLC